MELSAFRAVFLGASSLRPKMNKPGAERIAISMAPQSLRAAQEISPADSDRAPGSDRGHLPLRGRRPLPVKRIAGESVKVGRIFFAKAMTCLQQYVTNQAST